MKEFKKILLLLLAIVGAAMFSACSKEKDEPEKPVANKVSTYTVTSDFNISQLIGQSSILGIVDLTFYEYNESNELINYQEWQNVPDGATKKFTANKLAKKLTVFIKITAKQGTQENYLKQYSAQVYYLQDGENINIKLDKSTRVTTSNPI